MSTEELSFQEVEEILESIINNKTIGEINVRDEVEFLIFRFPTSDEIIQSRYIRKKALIEADVAGLFSIEEIDRLIIEKNLIPKGDREKLIDLEKKLEGQKKYLGMTKIPARKAPIEEAIRNYEQQISELKRSNDNFYYMSSEKKADEESLLYLAWAGTYNIDGDKYWPTFIDFENETDGLFRSEVLHQYVIFNQGLSLSKIRYIARHNLWRIRYMAATKSGGSLFKRDLNDLTTDQLSLLYWSSYYQSIYEMMPDDQPEAEIINDDELLDKFMERYFTKKEAERNEGKIQRGSSPSGKNKLSAWDRGEELIITPAHDQYMHLQYSEERIKAPDEKVSEIEVINPQSRRARNRRLKAGRPHRRE